MIRITELAPFPNHRLACGIHQDSAGVPQIRADGTQVDRRRLALRVRGLPLDRALQGGQREGVGHDRARLAQTHLPRLGDLPDLGIGDGQQLGLNPPIQCLLLGDVKPPGHAANGSSQDGEQSE